MTYPYYPLYDTRDWEDSRSLLSSEQMTAPLDDYSSETPVQQMDSLWYKPMYPTVDPEWEPYYPQLGKGAYVSHDDSYFPQQSLLTEGSNYETEAMAYSPEYAYEEPTSLSYLPYDAPQLHGAVPVTEVPAAHPSTAQYFLAPEAPLFAPWPVENAGSAAQEQWSESLWHPGPILPEPEGAVAGPLDVNDSLEGNALHQTTITSGRSVSRNDPENEHIPDAVKVSGEGQSHEEAADATEATEAFQTGRQETPYLSTEWNCDKCERGFVRIHELVRHWRRTRTHKSTLLVELSLVCMPCKKVFSREDSLRAHRRNFHI